MTVAVMVVIIMVVMIKVVGMLSTEENIEMITTFAVSKLMQKKAAQ